MKPAKRNGRTAELGRIHILAKELGLDRENYENVLYVQARVTSASKLDTHGRLKVIAALEERQQIQKRGVAAYPGRPRNADVDARRELKKIEALLTDAGLPWTYAIAILNRQTRGKKNRLEFADGSELLAVVAALEKAALKRLQAELETELTKPVHRRLHLDPEAIAILGFGFPRTWSLEKNTRAMSQVLRWLRGTLPAACAWPASEENLRGCCGLCATRYLEQRRGG